MVDGQDTTTTTDGDTTTVSTPTVTDPVTTPVNPDTGASKSKSGNKPFSHTGLYDCNILDFIEGRKPFNAGEIDVLKNAVKDSDLQSLMLAVINLEEETIDPKS